MVENVRGKASPLDRYRYLSRLQGENETLFYRVLLDHMEEMMPVVYTPTVGEACLQWSHIYEQPRGLYISSRHRGRFSEILNNWPRRDVRVIVVTDGGRILGLGDLGANGMGILIGKLALYTACAGVSPEMCLPVTIDVGTDNGTVLSDPLYLGEHQPRLAGDEYDAVLDEFVSAARSTFPRAIVQFEDFNNVSAFRLLRRYRTELCCFNDDIQGTGAMGLAGLYAAGRLTGRKLSEQRILFVGAGEACLGIGRLVTGAMRREGLSDAEAKQRCLFIDSKGLVVTSRVDLAEHKRPFAQDRVPTPGLLATVEEFEPSVLIGACGQHGMFTQPVLEALSRLNERPIVFALSNPTAMAECTAVEAYQHTHGRVIFASGSPFAPVAVDGRTCIPGQGNNAFIFPGVGLGLLVTGARRATEEMFFAAAEALASQVSGSDLERGRIFPPASRMRDVAVAVSTAVARVAYEQDLAAQPRPTDLSGRIRQFMYEPRYA